VRRAEHHPIDEHPRPHSAATSVAISRFLDVVLFTSVHLKAAAQSGMPRDLGLLFVGLINAA
jgi:hypothetical protein